MFSLTLTVFPFFMNVHNCRGYHSPLSKELHPPRKDWSSVLACFRTHPFLLKARMSISLDSIAWIYFPSPILIFSTVSNSRRFHMCHASLDTSKLYSCRHGSDKYLSFPFCIFFSWCFSISAFLDPMPWFVAVMSHVCVVWRCLFWNFSHIDAYWQQKLCFLPSFASCLS